LTTKPRRVWQDGFWISKTEVTRAQFKKAGLDPGNPNPPPGVKLSDDMPVWGMQLEGATAYCKWLTMQLQSQKLLAAIPTNNQWEKAARGTDGRLYPWGNSYRRAFGIPFKEMVDGKWHPLLHGYLAGKLTLRPVGTWQIDTSPYGVKDMVGNVGKLTLEEEPEIRKALKGDDRVQGRLVRGCGFKCAIQEAIIPYHSFVEVVGFQVVLMPTEGQRKGVESQPTVKPESDAKNAEPENLHEAQEGNEKK